MALSRRARRFSLEDARWRLRLLSWLTVFCFLGVWARLIYLQTVKAEELRAAAERYGGLRKRTWTVYGNRGMIKDRHGNVLAMDVMSLSVYIRPKAVGDARLVSRQLSPIVDLPAADIEARILSWKRRIEIGEQRRHRLVQTEGGKPAASLRAPNAFVLKRGITGEKARLLREALAQERRRLQQELRKTARFLSKGRPPSWVDGVDVIEEPHRYYPYGAIASALIGYADYDEQGRAGLEQLFESSLKATHGTVEGVVGAAGQVVWGTREVKVPTRHGSPLQLTIDVNIQNIAEECLQEVMQKHQPAGACAIVMDVHSGDLLAVANMPRIDLNRWQQEINKHGFGVMRNMATTFLFEPGSTFKTITIAAAMDAGRVGDNTRFMCTGSWQIGKHTITCVRHRGSRAHGRQTLQDVVARSCNVATAQIGMGLGSRALYEAVQKFGLLDKPLIGCEPGRLAQPEEWARIRLANVAFGQGIQVTPVGLASAYVAIANEGVYVKPRLLLQEPIERRVVLSGETARRMRRYLQAVVEEGTGKWAQVRGYAVAGKTGTAQKVVPGRRGYAPGKYVASFVGFAPADDPRIVVLVVVDEPRNGYYGGTVAAPAFAKITERVLTYLGVPSRSEEYISPSASLRSSVIIPE